MRKHLLLYAIAALAVQVLTAQSPAAFQYQAVVRNSAGEALMNKSVSFRMSILQGDAEGEAVYTETHDQGTMTSPFGMVTLEIGSGQSTGSLSEVDWSAGPYFLKTELDTEGGANFIHTGTTQLLSVPYSMYAERAGSVSVVRAPETHDSEEPVFQVQNRNGDVLFAVYESGVVVNIDEDSPKGSRAGFAVGGFSSQKDEPLTDYFTVERDNVNIYLDDDPTKGTRGGFAVGGFTSQKQGMEQDFMLLTPDNMFIWLDMDMAEAKGTRGGFAVGGFSRQKQGMDDMNGMSGTVDYLRVTPDSTRLWFDDSSGKGTRGGFAVGGFTSQKTGETQSYLSVTPQSSGFFIEAPETKPDPFGGFSISGLDTAGELRNLLQVTRDTTYIATTLRARRSLEVDGDINIGGTVGERTFIDERDGNEYRWVQIGNQIWMADNLRYEPGSKVYNDDTAFAEIYGFLYPWSTASNDTPSDENPSRVRGICPAGWHLPSESEWQEMANYLRGAGVAGEKLKSSRLWDGTNESRFDARPGGYGWYSDYDYGYSYSGEGNMTGFWTTTQSEPEGTANHYMRLQEGDTGITAQYSWDSPGDYQLHYVRCVKDR
ncbi:MAG: hypothetical protein EA408_00980 [Marinilabiliales bacterium]|nr:MAG: hypothetical protein EA408_00980 [Marinilabiliales bacterium]